MHEHGNQGHGSHGSGVGFAIGVISGTLFGVALGLLLAPKAGSELRGELGTRAREAKGRLRDQLRYAEERGREAAERGRAAVERGREVLSRGVDEARRFGKQGQGSATEAAGPGGLDM
jgi:gas vesicle protein